jgi:hypothetical protein
VTKRNQDFSMHIGETKTIFIDLSNEDGSEFDPAGCTFEWWLAKTSHSDKTLQKKLGAGLILATGGINVVLDSVDTYDLVPELWYHELKIYLGSTGVSVSTVGTVHLRPALDMRVVVNP